MLLAYDEKDVAAKTHYENKYFSIDVPEDWIGYWDVIEEENSLYVDQILYRLSYKPPVENYGGGTEIYILDISDTSVPLSVYRASIPDYAEESRGCISSTERDFPLKISLLKKIIYHQCIVKLLTLESVRKTLSCKLFYSL